MNLTAAIKSKILIVSNLHWRRLYGTSETSLGLFKYINMYLKKASTVLFDFWQIFEFDIFVDV